MKTIGLIGGMSWESTVPYYRLISEAVRARLGGRHGLTVLVPAAPDRELVHRVIFEELCLGQTLAASRAEFRRVMAELIALGAQAIVLGCTEIGLLVAAEDAAVPLFDTTEIHARSAAGWALGV